MSYQWRILRICAQAAVLVLLASCRNPGEKAATDTSSEAGKQPLIVGKCSNENVEGECKLYSIVPQNDTNNSGPSGTAILRIDHEIIVEDRSIVVTSGYFRVPKDSVKDFEEYYEKNSPVHCKAYVVYPPCNPQATWVHLNVDPPAFATPVRF